MGLPLQVVLDADDAGTVEDHAEPVRLGQRGGEILLPGVVGHDVDGDGRLLPPLLQDGEDADLVVAQDPRDLRQDARLVDHGKPEEELGLDLFEGGQGCSFPGPPVVEEPARRNPAGSAAPQVPRRLHHVARHGGCRGIHTGAVRHCNSISKPVAIPFSGRLFWI